MYSDCIKEIFSTNKQQTPSAICFQVSRNKLQDAYKEKAKQNIITNKMKYHPLWKQSFVNLIIVFIKKSSFFSASKISMTSTPVKMTAAKHIENLRTPEKARNNSHIDSPVASPIITDQEDEDDDWHGKQLLYTMFTCYIIMYTCYNDRNKLMLKVSLVSKSWSWLSSVHMILHDATQAIFPFKK